MDPSGLTLWLGERLLRIAESLLARSSRRRSFDAEVLEASIRVLNVTTDAALAVLDGKRRDPAIVKRLEEATETLWFDPALIPDRDAVYRLTRAVGEALLFTLGESESVDAEELRQQIRVAHSDVLMSAYKRRRELT